MALKLGIIGTNWITKMLVAAAHESQAYQLTAVYSRHAETGQVFAAEFGDDVAVYTDLTTFMTSGIEVVYIASPNSLHFGQAKLAIEHDVHVIVEKSAFSTPAEFEDIYTLLQYHPKVRLFEAARHIHQANFHVLTKQVQAMSHISGATLVFEKYSSRFDDYLAGREPNVLTREFSAGALTDLGIYPLYVAISLFGLPVSSHYFATKLTNGADGRGTAILRYPNFDVTLIFGKGSNSYLQSEILGLRDTITIDGISEFNEIAYHDGQGQTTVISEPLTENPMTAEMRVFAQVMVEPITHDVDYRAWLMLSQRVNLVLMQLRQDAGIIFPADK